MVLINTCVIASLACCMHFVIHMVFPIVFKTSKCLVPGFGTWFLDLTAQNTDQYMMSALAWRMVFGTEIVHSILIIIRL